MQLEQFALRKIEEYKFAIKGRHQRMPAASSWSSNRMKEQLEQQNTQQTSSFANSDPDQHLATDVKDVEMLDKCPELLPVVSISSPIGSRGDAQAPLKQQNTMSMLRHSANEAQVMMSNKPSQAAQDQSEVILQYLQRIEAQVRDNSEMITTHIESVTALSRQLTENTELTDVQARISNFEAIGSLMRSRSNVIEEMPHTKQEEKEQKQS